MPSDNDSDLMSLENHVVLFHGDLANGDHIHSIQLQSPSKIWLAICYFQPCTVSHQNDFCQCYLANVHLGCKDNTGLISDISVLCPKETGKFASKPGFCCTH